MSDTDRPARVPLLLRNLVLLISSLYQLVPARLTDLFAVLMARLAYWKGHPLHARVLQDFRDNVDPTAQHSSRKWRPVRAMYRALVRNANDALWFLTASRAAALRRFRIADPSPLVKALEAGGGPASVSPQVSRWLPKMAVAVVLGSPSWLSSTIQCWLVRLVRTG